MKMNLTKPMCRVVAFCAVLMLLAAGCAPGSRHFEQGQQLMAEQKYDKAVEYFTLALQEENQNNYYRLKLQEARMQAAKFYFEQGLRAKDAGRTAEAMEKFQVALAFNPVMETATQELERVRRMIQAQKLVEDAEQFFRARKYLQAKRILNRVLEIDPGNERARSLMKKVADAKLTVIDGQELEIASGKPITLKFNEANLRDVFQILSQLSGINFLFDEDLEEEKVTVYLEEATFAQALELLMKMNGLEKKVLNPKTILLYAKTKDKEKQYQDQIIQTFYLSNIDAKKAVNLLRTMLQLRKIFVHEELNALVIRDTPDVVRLSQQILQAADRADSEVVFDVELIEVSRGDDTTLGAQLSAYAVSLGMANEGSDTIVSSSLSSGTETGNLVSSASSLESFYTLPSATFDFAKTLTDTELLASPRIRVKNKEKAKVHIGAREPVITVTINGDNRSDNVQYVDIGVKLNVEPNIQLDDHVITKLNLEVSSISDRRTLESGTSVFTITTTNAESVLSLKDGERTVIGGLIRDTKSSTTKSIPGLGDLPLVGGLFTHNAQKDQKREILLSITPHIVKNVEMPLADVATIWSGGEDELKSGPNFGSFLPDFAPELEKGNPSPVPRLTEPPEPVLPRPEAGRKDETDRQGRIPESGQPQEAPLPEDEEVEEVRPLPKTSQSLPQPPAVAAEEMRTPIIPEEVQEEERAALPREEDRQPTEPPFAQPGIAAPSDAQIERVDLPPLEIAAPQAPGRLFFSGPELVETGQTLVLSLKVAEVEDLYSAPLYVTYDPEKLEFLRAREGDFLSQGDHPTIFTTSVSAKPGVIIVGYKQGTGGDGASGSGELFNLEMRAKNPGTTEIDLKRINFRDPGGERLQVESSSKIVEIR